MRRLQLRTTQPHVQIDFFPYPYLTHSYWDSHLYCTCPSTSRLGLSQHSDFLVEDVFSLSPTGPSPYANRQNRGWGLLLEA